MPLEMVERKAAVPRAVKGVVVRHPWQKHLLTFLMVVGPGLIVMEADNDAGAVSTYMQAGGQYGLHLLWILLLLLPICYFVQEMVARLGIHPIDDIREQKCSSEGLEPIKMTLAVRISLGVLRAYLVAMTIMLGYHAFALAGIFHKLK